MKREDFSCQRLYSVIKFTFVIYDQQTHSLQLENWDVIVSLA